MIEVPYLARPPHPAEQRQRAGQSKREEWAQGFILNVESGYTEGTVGLGLDALGMLGIKLDSGPGRSGTDLLPAQDDGGTPDEYSKLGLTAKVRASKSELRLGTHIPELPVVKASNSRILPQVFEGGLLTSKEISNLTLTGGRLNEVKDRASTNSEDLAINNKNKRFAAAATGDHFDLGGLDYAFTERVTGRYFFAELEDVYRQNFFGLLASQPLATPNAHDLAALLHTSARTLHRQLKEEGASLQALKDAVRRERASQ